MNLADTGGSTPRSQWVAPPSWWAGAADAEGQANRGDADVGGRIGDHHQQEQVGLLVLQASNNGHQQLAPTPSASFASENRLLPQRQQRVGWGRDPRSMFGDLPNSSFDTELLGDPIRCFRELDHQREAAVRRRPSTAAAATAAAAAAAAIDVDPALPPNATNEVDLPQRAGLIGSNEEFWRRECSRLQDQLESLTNERERWEQDRRRLVSDDVDRARDLVGLKRAVEAQSQLVMESLIAAQRLATASSSALSESALPQGLPHNSRAQSNTRNGSAPPDNDNPTALRGMLPVETFAQHQQTYADRITQMALPVGTFAHRQQLKFADRRPHMDDVVARYSRGGASRRRYREAGQQQASRQADAMRQLQRGATGGGGATRDYSRISRTGHMPPDPAPRNLRMYYDRGRSGWHRVVVSGSDGHNGNDGDGGSGRGRGSGSGSGGDGRRKIWEWNGRRVVLQVSPTETTPATVETSRPSAEPDEVPSREGWSATEAPHTEELAAAAEATAQIVSTSLLNEINKIKAAVRDLTGAVGARPPPRRGDMETVIPLSSSDESASTPSVTASHQREPPGAKQERSDQTTLEQLDASLSRRVSPSTRPMHPESSANSTPAGAIKNSNDAASTPDLRTHSPPVGGEANRGADNPSHMPHGDESSGNKVGGGGEQEMTETGVSTTTSLRPSIEELTGDVHSPREEVTRLTPRAEASVDREGALEHSRSSSNFHRSSSIPLVQVPDNTESGIERQGFGLFPDNAEPAAKQPGSVSVQGISIVGEDAHMDAGEERLLTVKTRE